MRMKSLFTGAMLSCRKVVCSLAQEYCVPSTHTSAASAQEHWIQIFAHSTPIHTFPPPMVQINRTHTDWVIVEYTLNAMRGYGGEKLDTAERRALERLLRKLLLVPSRPAVTLVHTYAVSAGGAFEKKGGAWRGGMYGWVWQCGRRGRRGMRGRRGGWWSTAVTASNSSHPPHNRC